MLNVLEIAREVANDVGIRGLDSLVSNTEPHAQALLTQINQSGNNLAMKRNAFSQGWSALTREVVFETVPEQDEYPFPEDFNFLVNGTLWDRSEYQPSYGPLTPKEWQLTKSGLVGNTSIYYNYRIRGTSTGPGRSLFLDPTPGPGEIRTLVYEYVSWNWLASSDNQTFRRRVREDLDTPLFDEQLMIMDLNWRFREARGLSYAPQLAQFEMLRDEYFGRDTGSRDIKLSPDHISPFYANIPETGFGQ